MEVLKDVAFGFAPLTEKDAERLIMGLKISDVFKGDRRQEASDIPALVDTLCRLSQLVMDFPEIVELDINPLFALPAGQGAKVSDARIVID